jgi:hypothetical protein
MTLITYRPQISQTADFVSFWERLYNYPLEYLYTNNIGQPLTSDSIHALFEWKNGSVLSAAKRRSVEQNYVAQS